MARPKRYFLVSHDIFTDPELEVIKTRVGRHLKHQVLPVWLYILSGLDRTENQFPVPNGAGLKTIQRILGVEGKTFLRVMDECIVSGWLTVGERSVNGRRTVLSAPTYWKYHRVHAPSRRSPILSESSPHSPNEQKIPKSIIPSLTATASHSSIPNGNGKLSIVRGSKRTHGAPSADTWQAYADAYRARYRIQPVRNAKVNSQLKQLVERLGKAEAPSVAAFYLTHNGPFYVQKRHPVNLLVADAEGLRTQWATGVKATSGEAKNAEHVDDVCDQVERVRSMMEAYNGPR